MSFFGKFKISMNPSRMRYQKNTFSYLFCLTALILDILSLSSILGYPRQTLPELRTGLDVICHILFLMLCFMLAEKTKRYSLSWGFGAFVAAAFQLCRIALFILPYYAHGLMSVNVLILNIVYCSLAAACLAAAGAMCLVRHSILTKNAPSECGGSTH